MKKAEWKEALERNRKAMAAGERVDPRRYVRINSKSWSSQPSTPRATDTRAIRMEATPSDAWRRGEGYRSARSV